MGRRTKRTNTKFRQNNYPYYGTDCTAESCVRGGSCVRVWNSTARVCVCAGAWGGARCQRYLGHDHACAQRACPAPARCVWRPAPNADDFDVPYCVCVEGAACPLVTGAAAPGGGGGGAWAGAVAAVLILASVVLAALYLLHRRRQGAFTHARLADNVEINNPMYLAGEDEPETLHHANGNHFANPVYESMYAPQQSPAEEHANLLSADSPPAADL